MPMKKVILAACVAATPALAGSPEIPWDRPTLTPPVTPPTLTRRICDEDFEKIAATRWLRTKTGKVYTLSQRNFFAKKCRPVDEPQECRRVEREGQTPRFVEICTREKN